MALTLLLAACAPQWAWRHDRIGEHPLPCAALGSPGTRAGLVAELDVPQREFARDRIAMWHLVDEDGRCIALRRSRNPRGQRHYTLVVEFDVKDRVSRWSLVEAS